METKFYNSDKNCSDIFIYGFGLTGKWLSDNIDKKVSAFIDTDRKKRGRRYNGINVIYVEDAKKLLNENSEIFPRNLIGMAKLCHEIEIDFLKKFKNKKSNFISGVFCSKYFKINCKFLPSSDKYPVSSSINHV